MITLLVIILVILIVAAFLARNSEKSDLPPSDSTALVTKTNLRLTTNNLNKRYLLRLAYISLVIMTNCLINTNKCSSFSILIKAGLAAISKRRDQRNKL